MVMYELLDLKWITKKDLLYSTWNSAQYYTAVQMGGGFFFFFFLRVWEMDTCICMVEYFHCSSETITPLFFFFNLFFLLVGG